MKKKIIFIILLFMFGITDVKAIPSNEKIIIKKMKFSN